MHNLTHVRRIVTISGPSGSGKTTAAKFIQEELSFCAGVLLSVTTRVQRSSDVPGEYVYVTQEDFAKMLHDGLFAWTVQVGEDHYGTLCETIRDFVSAPEGRANIGIMVITPDTVTTLRTILEGWGKLDMHRPVFMIPPHQSRQRIAARSHHDPVAIAQFDTRLVREEHHWYEDALNSSARGEVPYTFLPNDGTLDDLRRNSIALFLEDIKENHGSDAVGAILLRLYGF